MTDRLPRTREAMAVYRATEEAALSVYEEDGDEAALAATLDGAAVHLRTTFGAETADRNRPDQAALAPIHWLQEILAKEAA